jgi:phosphoenolpyruvate carboxykinase (ATP)
VPGLKQWNSGIVVTMVLKGQQDPVIRTSSPAPLAQDFARQQVSKQQRSNFHSSSISSSVANIMVSQSVNKTGLHPAGVQ